MEVHFGRGRTLRLRGEIVRPRASFAVMRRSNANEVVVDAVMDTTVVFAPEYEWIERDPTPQPAQDDAKPMPVKKRAAKPAAAKKATPGKKRKRRKDVPSSDSDSSGSDFVPSD